MTRETGGGPTIEDAAFSESEPAARPLSERQITAAEEEDAVERARRNFIGDFYQGVAAGLIYDREEDEKQRQEVQVELRKQQQMNAELIEFQKKAEHDKLTGLLNREGFENFMAEIQKKNIDGSVLILDIDKFKEINDGYGHPKGDAVLRAVAAYMRTFVRSSDAICRWGGDEIVIFFPGASPEDILKIFYSEAIGKAVINMPFDFEDPEHRADNMVTFSGGIVPLSHDTNIENGLKAADIPLYEVKKKLGRNQIISGPAFDPASAPAKTETPA